MAVAVGVAVEVVVSSRVVPGRVCSTLVVVGWVVMGSVCGGGEEGAGGVILGK